MVARSTAYDAKANGATADSSIARSDVWKAFAMSISIVTISLGLGIVDPRIRNIDS